MIETKAAVLTATGGDWEICDLRVDAPRAGEVLVRLAYAGLCYSDEHVRFDSGARLPIVGGHEGSGVVVETGPGVTGLATGDHVALTFVAVCGRCHWCASGRANLCESGRRAPVRSSPWTRWSPSVTSRCGSGPRRPRRRHAKAPSSPRPPTRPPAARTRSSSRMTRRPP